MAEKLAYQGHHDRILLVARKKCGSTNGYCSDMRLMARKSTQERLASEHPAHKRSQWSGNYLVCSPSLEDEAKNGSPDALRGGVPSLGTYRSAASM